MSLRFSAAGPEFPEQLVDALLTGDVVFLCGAGVSAPHLPGFGALVTRCFAGLNVDMSASEQLSFKENRFEEALGSLSRRIVNPADMTRAVVAELQPPVNADLSHHRTILRLSRDLENRPAIVTTNFDMLIERALIETEDADQVRAFSFAGQDLPQPGSAGFGGIIHIHGRIADPDLGLAETPLIVTSADYGDAYMRSGWASRFLFDLCRTRLCKNAGIC
jgi:NAD-dependent SIR2 family protein deacetylase